jgi:hypothetical protein
MVTWSIFNSAAHKTELDAQQTANNLVDSGIGTRFNLNAGLILDGMRDIDGIKLRPAERGGLRAGGSHEFGSGHGHRGRAGAFQI